MPLDSQVGQVTHQKEKVYSMELVSAVMTMLDLFGHGFLA
jgi:hypothetical protein